MIVGKGDTTSFWRDTWLCETPLKDTCSQLFEICNEPKISVAEAARRGWQLSFRRWLNERLQAQFRNLRDLLTAFAVNIENDKPKWRWENNGLFLLDLLMSISVSMK